MHPTAIEHCKKFIAKYLDPQVSLKIAEVGADGQNGSYRLNCVIANPNWQYTTFDMSNQYDVDVKLSSPEDWQLAPEHIGAYDVIICGQVLEHVRRPWKFIHQLRELGHPGTILYLAAPNTWDFHEYPIDCWRIWPDGMRTLFEDAHIQDLETYFVHADTIGIGRFLKVS